MGADELLAADQVDVDHLLTEHCAACAELHRLRQDRTLLLDVVGQLHGWIATEFDPEPGSISDYLILDPDLVDRTAALLTEVPRG